jgi:hypothetical protein
MRFITRVTLSCAIVKLPEIGGVSSVRPCRDSGSKQPSHAQDVLTNALSHTGTQTLSTKTKV